MQQLARPTKAAVSADRDLNLELSREVLDSLPPVMWFIRRQMRRHRSGLSLAQFRALVRLEHPGHGDGEMGVSEVAEHLGVSKPTASRVLAGLVSRGFAQRREMDGDRRRVSLTLTPRGRSILESSRVHAQSLLAAEFSGLTGFERKQMSAAMASLRRVFGAVRPGG